MVDRLRILHLTERWIFATGTSTLTHFGKFRNPDFFEVEFGTVLGCDARRAAAISGEGFKIHDFKGSLDALASFVKNEGIDVVHLVRAGYEMLDAIRTVRAERIPILAELNVFGLHGLAPEDRMIDLHLMQSMTAALRYMAYARQSVESFLQDGGVMYLPMDFERFERLRPPDLQRVKERLGAPPGSHLICRIGRPDLHKWSYFLLHALSLIIERLPNTRLLIVGGVLPAVRRAIKKWGLEKYVIILQQVPDEEIVQILHSIDLLTHSSHIGESFGATIAEAMSARKPVVVNSTDWADNAQVELVDHGVTGLVVNTPRAYADAVLRLLRDRELARQMGEAGHQKVRKRFAAQRVAASLEKSYSEIADKKGIKVGNDRTEYYKLVENIPSKNEIREWPHEYKRRLTDCGCAMSAFEGRLVRTAWMATNVFPKLRETRIPNPILSHGGKLSYLSSIS